MTAVLKVYLWARVYLHVQSESPTNLGFFFLHSLKVTDSRSFHADFNGPYTGVPPFLLIKQKSELCVEALEQKSFF